MDQQRITEESNANQLAVIVRPQEVQQAPRQNSGDIRAAIDNGSLHVQEVNYDSVRTVNNNSSVRANANEANNSSCKAAFTARAAEVGVATFVGAAVGASVGMPLVGALASCVGSTCEKMSKSAISWEQRVNAPAA